MPVRGALLGWVLVASMLSAGVGQPAVTSPGELSSATRALIKTHMRSILSGGKGYIPILSYLRVKGGSIANASPARVPQSVPTTTPDRKTNTGNHIPTRNRQRWMYVVPDENRWLTRTQSVNSRQPEESTSRNMSVAGMRVGVNTARVPSLPVTNSAGSPTQSSPSSTNTPSKVVVLDPMEFSPNLDSQGLYRAGAVQPLSNQHADRTGQNRGATSAINAISIAKNIMSKPGGVNQQVTASGDQRHNVQSSTGQTDNIATIIQQSVQTSLNGDLRSVGSEAVNNVQGQRDGRNLKPFNREQPIETPPDNRWVNPETRVPTIGTGGNTGPVVSSGTVLNTNDQQTQKSSSASTRIQNGQGTFGSRVEPLRINSMLRVPATGNGRSTAPVVSSKTTVHTYDQETQKSSSASSTTPNGQGTVGSPVEPLWINPIPKVPATGAGPVASSKTTVEANGQETQKSSAASTRIPNRPGALGSRVEPLWINPIPRLPAAGANPVVSSRTIVNTYNQETHRSSAGSTRISNGQGTVDGRRESLGNTNDQRHGSPGGLNEPTRTLNSQSLGTLGSRLASEKSVNNQNISLGSNYVPQGGISKGQIQYEASNRIVSVNTGTSNNQAGLGSIVAQPQAANSQGVPNNQVKQMESPNNLQTPHRTVNNQDVSSPMYAQPSVGTRNGHRQDSRDIAVQSGVNNRQGTFRRPLPVFHPGAATLGPVAAQTLPSFSPQNRLYLTEITGQPIQNNGGQQVDSNVQAGPSTTTSSRSNLSGQNRLYLTGITEQPVETNSGQQVPLNIQAGPSTVSANRDTLFQNTRLYQTGITGQPIQNNGGQQVTAYSQAGPSTATSNGQNRVPNQNQNMPHPIIDASRTTVMFVYDYQGGNNNNPAAVNPQASLPTTGSLGNRQKANLPDQWYTTPGVRGVYIPAQLPPEAYANAVSVNSQTNRNSNVGQNQVFNTNTQAVVKQNSARQLNVSAQWRNFQTSGKAMQPSNLGSQASNASGPTMNRNSISNPSLEMTIVQNQSVGNSEPVVVGVNNGNLQIAPSADVNRGIPVEVNGGIPVEVNGGIPGEVNGGIPAEVNGGIPVEVNGGIPAEVNGRIPAEVNGGIPAVVNGTFTLPLGVEQVTTESMMVPPLLGSDGQSLPDYWSTPSPDLLLLNETIPDTNMSDTTTPLGLLEPAFVTTSGPNITTTPYGAMNSPCGPHVGPPNAFTTTTASMPTAVRYTFPWQNPLHPEYEPPEPSEAPEYDLFAAGGAGQGGAHVQSGGAYGQPHSPFNYAICFCSEKPECEGVGVTHGLPYEYQCDVAGGLTCCCEPG